MKTDKLEIKVALQISKPIDIVFEAIINPDKMTNYFISKSTGIMEEGKELIWNFPEFDMDYAVRVGKIEVNKYISYYWNTEVKELFVEIMLESQANGSTLVSISETGMPNNEEGLKWFEEEIAYQIYQDGTFLQFSMNYHRVVVQLLTLAIPFAEKNNDTFRAVVKKRALSSYSIMLMFSP